MERSPHSPASSLSRSERLKAIKAEDKALDMKIRRAISGIGNTVEHAATLGSTVPPKSATPKHNQQKPKPKLETSKAQQKQDDAAERQRKKEQAAKDQTSKQERERSEKATADSARKATADAAAKQRREQATQLEHDKEKKRRADELARERERKYFAEQKEATEADQEQKARKEAAFLVTESKEREEREEREAKEKRKAVEAATDKKEQQVRELQITADREKKKKAAEAAAEKEQKKRRTDRDKRESVAGQQPEKARAKDNKGVAADTYDEERAQKAAKLKERTNRAKKAAADRQQERERAAVMSPSPKGMRKSDIPAWEQEESVHDTQPSVAQDKKLKQMSERQHERKAPPSGLERTKQETINRDKEQTRAGRDRLAKADKYIEERAKLAAKQKEASERAQKEAADRYDNTERILSPSSKSQTVLAEKESKPRLSAVEERKRLERLAEHKLEQQRILQAQQRRQAEADANEKVMQDAVTERRAEQVRIDLEERYQQQEIAAGIDHSPVQSPASTPRRQRPSSGNAEDRRKQRMELERRVMAEHGAELRIDHPKTPTSPRPTSPHGRLGNRNTPMSREEMHSMMGTSASESEVDLTQELFNQVDTDGDGVISPAELVHAAEVLMAPPPQSPARPSPNGFSSDFGSEDQQMSGQLMREMLGEPDQERLNAIESAENTLFVAAFTYSRLYAAKYQSNALLSYRFNSS